MHARELGRGFAAVLIVAGCAIGRPSTREERLEAAARDRAKYCGGGVNDAFAALLQQGGVVSVEPLVEPVRTGRIVTGRKLRGATVHVRALPGMTREWLERIIGCHAALRILDETVLDDGRDPFWLPDGWVSIGVRSERGGFLVELHGATADEALEILDRARALLSKDSHNFGRLGRRNRYSRRNTEV